MHYKVCIVESSYIVNEGLKKIVSSIPRFDVMAQFSSFSELEMSREVSKCQLIICNPDLIKTKQSLIKIRIFNPNVKLLIIDSQKNPQKDFLNPASVEGYIFLCCHTEEVLKALISVAAGEKFFCNKALDFMVQPKAINSCNPVNLSERELEVLKFIARGKSSKQISVELCLSFHTITTHRKNMCKKLNVCKASELIAFAHNNNLI